MISRNGAYGYKEEHSFVYDSGKIGEKCGIVEKFSLSLSTINRDIKALYRDWELKFICSYFFKKIFPRRVSTVFSENDATLISARAFVSANIMTLARRQKESNWQSLFHKDGT